MATGETMADKQKAEKCVACDGTGECDGAKCGTCDGTGKAPVEKSGGVIEAAAHAFPAAAHAIHVAEGLGITAGAAAVASHHGGKVLGKLRGIRDKGVPKPGRMYVMNNKQYRVAHTDAVGVLMHHVPTGHGPQGESQFVKAKQFSAHIKSGKIAPLATGHHKSEVGGDLAKAAQQQQEGPGMSSVFAELNKAVQGETVAKSVGGPANGKPDADEAKAAAKDNPFVGPDACLWEDFTAGLQPGNALGEVTRTHSGGVVLKYPVLDGNGTIHVNMDESTWKGLVHNIGQLGDKVKDPPMSGKTGIKKSEGEDEGDDLAKSEEAPQASGEYEPQPEDRATDLYGRGFVIKSVADGLVTLGYAEDPHAEDVALTKSDVLRMFSDPQYTVERNGTILSVDGSEERRELGREYSRVRLHRRPGDRG